MTKIIGKNLNTDPRNLIINGNMDFSQRAPGGTVGMTLNQYTADRWKWITTSATPQTNFVWDTSVPSLAQSGYLSNKSLKLAAAATFSPSSTDQVYLVQGIEGYNVGEIMNQPISISFWVKANFTGIGCVALQNAGQDRSYVVEYTIAQANVWQEVSFQLLMLDGSSGSWSFDNNVGLYLFFTLTAGSTFQTTPGSWQTGNFVATSNQFNLYSSSSNTIQFSQVMLSKGSEVSPFSRAGLTFEKELTLCQRYYEKSYDLLTSLATATFSGATSFAFKDSTTNIAAYWTVPYKTRKRVSPASLLNFFSPNSGSINNIVNIQQGGGFNDLSTSGTAVTQGESGFSVEVNSSGTTAGFSLQWSSDCDF